MPATPRRAVILTTEPPDQPGGLERYVTYLVRGLEARGYTVDVFHRENTWPSWLPRDVTNRASRLLTNAIQGFFIGRAAARKMREGADLVVSNSTVGWYPLRRGRAVKMAHIYHGTYWGLAAAMREDLTTPGYYILRFWDCQVLERLGAVRKVGLANSEQTRAELRRVFGYDAATVWCPLDLRHFVARDSKQARAALGVPEGRPVVLFVGHALGMKGFRVIEQLMARLRGEVHWLLVLRGPLPDGLEGRRDVTVVRDAGYDQMPWIYSASDVAVLPSKYESFGYVVAEALACGLPVVSSPGGASKTFCASPPLDALVVRDAKDSSGFERSVRAVLDDPARFRAAVARDVHPHLRELHDDRAWWERFFGAIDEKPAAAHASG